MLEKVFVYGTLMKSHYNHYYMKREGVKFLGKGRAGGFALYDVTPYYPGAIKENGESVLGEVYEVPEECMEKIDLLEGNGRLYRREKISVVLENGKVEDCWIYLWLHNVHPETKVPLEQQPWRKSRMEICDICGGECGWDCDTCGEEIKEDCPECHGEGWTTCPECNGKGFVICD